MLKLNFLSVHIIRANQIQDSELQLINTAATGSD